jgi:hypothetical protein
MHRLQNVNQITPERWTQTGWDRALNGVTHIRGEQIP